VFLKIAFINFFTLRLRRGIETLVLALGNQLVTRGLDVTVLTAHQTLEPLVKPVSGLKIHPYPVGKYFSATRIVPFYIADLLRNKYDVVNIFFADYGEGAAINAAKLFTNFKLYLYLCYPYDTVPHRYYSFARHGFNQGASRILADSQYVAEGAQRFFKRSIDVVPVGTDPKQFYFDASARQRMRQVFRFNDDDIVLLNVSALEKAKGTWRVLDALPRICSTNPRIKYMILGDGAYRAHLENKVKQLKLESNVIFGGTTASLSDYYKLADIFVMLPDAEANSVACHEAMASELPVVVADTGGFTEVVTSASGRLVNISSRDAIVEAILELARDRDLRQRMGRAGRARILADFTWERTAEKYLELMKA